MIQSLPDKLVENKSQTKYDIINESNLTKLTKS